MKGRKILAWLLAMTMVLTMIPLSAFAAENFSVELQSATATDAGTLNESVTATIKITDGSTEGNGTYQYTVTNGRTVNGSVPVANGVGTISGLKYGDHVKVYVTDDAARAAYFKVLYSALKNGSFEEGEASWHTTASDGRVEVNTCKTYTETEDEDHGKIAELNANECASMYQEINTRTSRTIRWSVAYAARKGETQETQQIAIVVGPALAGGSNDPYKKADAEEATKDIFMKIAETAEDKTCGKTCTVTYGEKNYQVTFASDTTTAASWKTYTEEYNVPNGQNETVFALVSLSGKSSGNLIDNVDLTTIAYKEARIGECGYNTLGEALTAASNSNKAETIEIIKETVAAVSTATLKAGDTLKTYAGDTYTPTAGATISVDENGDVTFTGGTLDVAGGSATIGAGVSVTGVSGKTIKNPDSNSDGKITVAAGSGKDTVTVLAKDGKVVINGVEYVTNEAGTKIEVSATGNKLIAGAVMLDQNEEIKVGNDTIIKSTGAEDKTITVKADNPANKSTVTVPAGGEVTIGETEYDANDNNTKFVVDGSGNVELTDGSATLNAGEEIHVGGVSITAPEGAKDIAVSATPEKTVNVPAEGKVNIGEAGITGVKLGTTLTINEDGKTTVNLPENGSATVNGVTYTSDGSGTVTIDPTTGKVIGVTGKINIAIEENKLTDDSFSYEMVSGTSVTIGKYVYTAPSDETKVGNVIIKGRGTDSDANSDNKALNPAVILRNANNAVEVSLKDDPTTKTTYTAAEANTVFAMAAGDDNTKNIELLNNKEQKLGLSVAEGDANSALKFIDKDSHTVDGVTYQAQTVKNAETGEVKAIAYTVTYGTAPVDSGKKNQDGSIVMETVSRNTVSVKEGSKVIAKMTAKGTINIDSGKIGDNTFADKPFTATNSNASILIDSTEGTSKISGNGSYLTEIKDESGKEIIGYKITRYSGGATTETTKAATTTATAKTETKTQADGTKTTTATVDNTTAAKIVKEAVEHKSEEVVVNARAAKALTETAAGSTTEIQLPEQTVQGLSQKTEARVTIKADSAEVTLDKAAVDGIASQAGTDSYVKLIVETVKQEAKLLQVDLKLVTSKGNVTDFKGGNVSVTVKLNTSLAAKPVVCVYIDDNNVYHRVTGEKNADGTYTFTTGHFSSYAVMAAEDADKVIAEQEAKAKELTKALSLKARSAKTAKGSIKVTLTVDEDAIKAIEDLGCTVKYKFYRSTKKASSYAAKIEGNGKTYINTSGKKGTRYYYKARVMVYDEEGNLLTKTNLKQCLYAARKK